MMKNSSDKKRNIEISMTHLSQQEKDTCVKILNANKNIVFTQDANGDYKATVLVSSSKLNKEQGVTPTKSNNNSVPLKRPLSEVVDTLEYPRLSNLCKFVEVYIHPKKMSLNALVAITEPLLQNYLQSQRIQQTLRTERSLAATSFGIFIYNELTKQNNQKPKFQQALVNLLQSVNAYKTKCTGIRIFHKVLSQTYTSECMAYLYFLRKMVESLKGTKILLRGKLNTDLNTVVVEQEATCRLLDSLYEQDSKKNILFQKLKPLMQYDPKKKKNSIKAYEMVEVLIDNFQFIDQLSTQSYERSQQALFDAEEQFAQNRAGSHNDDQELEQIEAQQAPEPISTVKYNHKNESGSIHNKCAENVDRFSEEENIVFLACLENLKKLCQQVSNPTGLYDQLSSLVSDLLYSIFYSDKMNWFRCTQLEPTPYRTQYIERLQKQYRMLKESDNIVLFMSRFVKKVLQAPGFHQKYIQYLMMFNEQNNNNELAQ